MRRLARRLFTLCSAVSLLLCIATCVLWVHSYRTGIAVVRRVPAVVEPPASGGGHGRVEMARWVVASGAGRLIFDHSREWKTGEFVRRMSGRPPRPGEWRWRIEEDPRDILYYYAPRTDRYALKPDHAVLGFALKFHRDDSRAEPHGTIAPHEGVMVETATELMVPHWLPAIVLLLSPAAWVARHHRRARRLRTGVCPSCGYDLRASPGRCPECGTAAVSHN